MPNAQPFALALTHVAFEDLDSLRPILEERGLAVQSVDASCEPLRADQILDADLLVILGGPIGVYEQEDYPFLRTELALLRQRLERRRPTLGICLGAQLMASALGARVYPGAAGAELGWGALQPGSAPAPAWFKPILDEGVQVLHWHGDTFDLPRGAAQLASTELYPNQAFGVENFALGLQFHLEVSAPGLERWYVGHTSELRQKKIDVQALRAAGQQQAPLLAPVARTFWNGWLDYIL